MFCTYLSTQDNYKSTNMCSYAEFDRWSITINFKNDTNINKPKTMYIYVTKDYYLSKNNYYKIN